MDEVAGEAAVEQAVTLTDAEPAAATAGMGPVEHGERYAVMDVLRGFALFGVLAANMRSFNLPLSIYGTPEAVFHGRADFWAQSLLNIFIAGKFYTLFAFLFGLGFAIQMTRAQARSAGTKKFPWFYLRRLSALALFGLVHGLFIWNGDILLAYSIGGFWLFWFRKAKRKTVEIWAATLWGLLFSLLVTAWVLARVNSAALGHINLGGGGPPPDMAAARQVIDVYAHSHLLGVVRETMLEWTGGMPPSRLHPRLWMVHTLAQAGVLGTISVAIFLLGLWVWRKGALENLGAWRPRLARVCAWTLPLGVALEIVVETVPHYFSVHAKVPTVGDLFFNLAGVFGVPILACGYATAMALLFTSERWQRAVLWLAPVGRMALTNYLSQSIVCVAFYSGIITGLYGRVGPAWDMVATVVLYAAQVFFSRWWLGRYRFGPAEWLWRAMTYGRRPQMRIAG